MHIQEGTNTTLTTCTKMTEEVDRRHGVNGNSSKGASEDAPVHNTSLASTGGRLKFFKDGKFILELVRGGGREGERAGWVSVPRKTFWPPAAPAPPAPPAPPALSLSDDNSSVQSSPWQRDHCWKQAAPRRNRSKELAMYYCRPASLATAAIAAGARARRRRPHEPPPEPPHPPNGLRKPPLTNGALSNGDADAPADDAADAAPPDYDREKYYHMKLKKPYQYHKLRVYKKTRSAFRRKELARVVERLRERAAALPAPVAKLAGCRQEHALVSPRKRILRELERVSLEDQGCKRRAKTVPALSTASYPPSPGPSGARAPDPRKEPPPPPPAKHVGSYSIHSLLSMPDEGGARRSPQQGGALRAESPAPAGRSPDPSPSPEALRYRYGGVHDSPPPRAWPAAAYRWPAYRSPARDEWRDPYAFGYGYGLYRAAPAAAPAPLWMHYAMAPAAPPGPWAPLPHPHPLLAEHIPKDEPTSDLPLNLSKH